MSGSSRDAIPLLSKSRFMSGLQCHKLLYLGLFHPDLATPDTPAKQAVFDAGTLVGELARELYPGGILISEDHLHHEAAMVSTERTLSDPATTAVFEAGFIHDDIRMRVDILARVSGNIFDLIEVKSTTRVKDEHIPDVAVQLYVLKGCGIEVRWACLCHLNNKYVYQGGDYDLGQLFSVEDITHEALEYQSDIPSALDQMRLPLWDLVPPDIKTGRQCTDPYHCPFYDHCHPDEPEHSVNQLPRARQELLQSLQEAGISDIRDIPEGFSGLSELQERVRDCVVNNRGYLDPVLPQALSELDYPIHFLDFETFNPALPLYVGTSPFQIIPFQWSDHIMDTDGTVRHEEFLHAGPDDPREAFARSLLETLGTSGAIVVYSPFEGSRINELIKALPELSSDLQSLLDGRIVDLLQLVRKHCYHPEFHGSFSLKSVLPALVPGLDYSHLDISVGDDASLAYAEMIQPDTAPDRRESLRKDLLAYCGRDTEAEVRLFKVLREGMQEGV